ncbi:MAG: glycosyltransferase family 2 protein [Pseudomonadota bacterium]
MASERQHAGDASVSPGAADGARPPLALSIIVPLYNEEDSVGPLHERIVQAVDPLAIAYEMLFVDDGSSDATFERASAIAADDPRLRVVRFRKNYGQTPAMAAGIDHAAGATLITMDGDLQNDPADIPNFLEKIAEGYDIVVGWRHKRQDKLITRKIPSMIANRLIGKVTGVPIKDNGCSLKAYRADLIKSVPLYSEMHRFIPAMTSLAGARVAQIKVRHHARQFGVSKYGLSRVYKVLLDLLTIKTIVSFSARPLVWFSLLGLPAALLSALCLLGSVVQFANGDVFPVPLAATGLLFGALTGFLLLGGLLGELVFRTGNVDLARLCALTLKSHGVDSTAP